MARPMRPKSIRLPARFGWGGRMLVVNTLKLGKPLCTASASPSKVRKGSAPARVMWKA